jgi:hypothetical protein
VKNFFLSDQPKATKYKLLLFEYSSYKEKVAEPNSVNVINYSVSNILYVWFANWIVLKYGPIIIYIYAL